MAGQGRDLGHESNRKLALVVGNSAYPKWPLQNPGNDAREVAKALAELGFQTESALDLTLPRLDRTISEFVSQVKQGDTAAFYYAGHGIQLEGENYLVPVDFDAKDETDAKYASYSASRIQERLEKAGAKVILIVLDACRNNPFSGRRSAGGGLAAMGSGKGTMIAFATAPGRTADDNASGSNGLFTTYLVESLRVPGLSLDQVFSRVRERVYTQSKGRQVPWTVSSVIGDVYLKPGSGQMASRVAPEPPAPQTTPARPISNPLSRLNRADSAPPQRTGASAPGPNLTAATAALERGEHQTAIETAQRALQVNATDAAALDLLARAYLQSQDWERFAPTARQSLAAGNKLEFRLGHHHTLTGFHLSVLTVSKETVSFQALGGNCNQKPFSYPASSIQAAQYSVSPKQEPYINFKVLDERKKQRNLNFVDADSQIGRDASGMPTIVSPAKSQGMLQAIASVLVEAGLSGGAAR